jgi:hypothetical protein
MPAGSAWPTLWAATANCADDGLNVGAHDRYCQLQSLALEQQPAINLVSSRQHCSLLRMSQRPDEAG